MCRNGEVRRGVSHYLSSSIISPEYFSIGVVGMFREIVQDADLTGRTVKIRGTRDRAHYLDKAGKAGRTGQGKGLGRVAKG